MKRLYLAILLLLAVCLLLAIFIRSLKQTTLAKDSERDVAAPADTHILPTSDHVITRPLVDMQGHPISAISAGIDDARLRQLNGLLPDKGNVIIAGYVALPSSETNRYIRLNIISDRHLHHSVQRSGDDGYFWASVSPHRGPPWRLKAKKPGYNTLILNLPTNHLSGGIVWVGTHTLQKCQPSEYTIVEGEIVSKSGNILAVDGLARLYMSGTGGDCQHYETDIAGGYFSFSNISPEEYYIAPKIAGYNTFHLCVDTRGEHSLTRKKIVAYPCIELTLREHNNEKGTTQTLRMGETQHDRTSFIMADGKRLFVSQYGGNIVFRTDKAGIRIAHSSGPHNSATEAAESVPDVKALYNQCTGKVQAGDWILLYGNEQDILSAIEITDVLAAEIR